jgi:VWFA-related protein
MRTRLAVAVVALFCSALAASAQVREQITVESIDVPVYVTSKGKAVRHLSKDDFDLYVNGKRQPIDYFEAIDFAEPPPAASPGTAPVQAQPDLRDRRLFLFVFDLVYNRPAALDRSRRAAVEMVDHALPNDLFAVATLSSNRGLTFAMPFMRDRDAIRRALLQLAPSSAHDELAISITGAEREMAEAWKPFVAKAGPMGEDTVSEIAAISIPEEQERALRIAKAEISALSIAAGRLRDLEGTKHLILFSEGFHIDPERQFADVQAMAAVFHSSNVFLHAMDLTPLATGAADPTVMSAAAGPAPVLPSDNQALLWVSAVTGGRWVHWTNLLAPALEELSASYSAGYRLGFKPVNARNGHNDIDVKVRNLPPGATLSFRKRFAGSAPSKAAPDALRLADIIENDTPQSGTPPEISVVGRRIDVMVPLIELSQQLGGVDGATVMLYVFNARGVPVLSSEKRFTIPQHAEADRVVQQKLDLAPGSYVAKVLLRADDSLAFAKQPFEIAPEEQPSH